MKNQIEKTYLINAGIVDVWKALTVPEIIEKWSGAKATMSEVEGDNFSLWGGDIYGTNTKVEPGKLLEQDWYGGKWEKPSRVRFELSKKENGTEVKLIHNELPEKEVSNFDQGWDDYYFDAIKALFE